MKQVSFSVLVVSLFLITSCKKESNDTNSKGAGGENSFTIDGKTYQASDVYYIESSNSIMAQKITPTSGLNEVQSVSITFSDDELPTTGGSFDVVSDPYSPGDNTDNSQVALLATTFPYDYGAYLDYNRFYPTLTPVQHVTVSINSNNKINVQFSNIAVKDASGKATTISGNITQP